MRRTAATVAATLVFAFPAAGAVAQPLDAAPPPQTVATAQVPQEESPQAQDDDDGGNAGLWGLLGLFGLLGLLRLKRRKTEPHQTTGTRGQL
jgi:MYXO-CTERM domain-containing protein